MNENIFSPLVVTKHQISLISDNIIILRYVENGAKLQKMIGILKARGNNHSRELRQYEITPNGIKILGKLDKENMLK